MRTAQYSVSTTPVLVVGEAGSNRTVYFHVETTPVFLGANGVTSTTGLKMDANDKLTMRVNGGSEIWAVTATGTAPVYVMEVLD